MNHNSLVAVRAKDPRAAGRCADAENLPPAGRVPTGRCNVGAWLLPGDRRFGRTSAGGSSTAGASANGAMAESGSRRGVVMIAIVALLGMLSLMGFIAYTMAAQEFANATYFAEATKNRQRETSPGQIAAQISNAEDKQPGQDDERLAKTRPADR